MSIQKNRYDWVAYYMAAYEEERKKNTQMAGRIATRRENRRICRII